MTESSPRRGDGCRRSGRVKWLGFLAAALLVAAPVGAQTFDDAVAAYDTYEYERAAELFESLAQQGHVKSQYNIGLMYENGNGVERRPDLAFFWYQMAALNGNNDAKYNLGGLYFRGEGVERSIEEAVRWWTEAANAGDPNAAYNLGVVLAGDGTDKEALKAAMIRLKQASDQGHPHATVLLEDFSRVVEAPDSMFFSAAPDVPAIEALAMPGEPRASSRTAPATAAPVPAEPDRADADGNRSTVSSGYRDGEGVAYGSDGERALEVGRSWIDLQPRDRYTVKVYAFYDADVALWYLKKWGFGGPGAIFAEHGEINLAIGTFDSRGSAKSFLRRLRQHAPGVDEKHHVVVPFSRLRS